MARSRTSISTAIRLAKRLMPDDGDLEGFLEALSAHRRRPIRLLAKQFGGDGVSGLWLATASTDYLVFDEHSNPARRVAVICHEVGHMLLGHRTDAALAALVNEVAPDLSPGLVARALARHAYDSTIENDAERVATAVGFEHTRRQAAANGAGAASRRWSVARLG